MNVHWAGGDGCHTVGVRSWLACVAGDLRALCDVAGTKAVMVDY